MSSAINPYAAPANCELTKPDRPGLATRSAVLRLVLWCVVCYVSAIPSLILGNVVAKTPDRMQAMFLGTTCFAFAFWLGERWFVARWMEQNRRMRIAARIGFGTRMVVSLVVPVGMAVDMLPGLLSVVITSQIFGFDTGYDVGPNSFASVVVVTIIQGVFLNVILLAYMAVVYVVMMLVGAIRDDGRQSLRSVFTRSLGHTPETTADKAAI